MTGIYCYNRYATESIQEARDSRAKVSFYFMQTDFFYFEQIRILINNA